MSEGLIAGTIIILLLLFFLVLFISEYQKRRKQHMDEKAQFQHELLRSQIEIQEQTLKNISQEIHDNIGQTLSLAKLNLNTIPAEQQNGLSEKIGYTKDLVSKAILDLRSLSKVLNKDAILHGGLLHALEWELAQLQRSGVFETELITSGTQVTVDPEKELILFRIVQEAINNSIRHAAATKITVRLQYEKDFVLSIADNGAGFNSEASHAMVSGIGLKNMRNRAALIGGLFEIKSSNKNGTEIIITLPNAST